MMAPLLYHAGRADRRNLRGTPGNDGGERTRGLSLGSQQRVRGSVAITVRQFLVFFEVCCYHKAAYDKVMEENMVGDVVMVMMGVYTELMGPRSSTSATRAKARRRPAREVDKKVAKRVGATPVEAMKAKKGAVKETMKATQTKKQAMNAKKAMDATQAVMTMEAERTMKATQATEAKAMNTEKAMDAAQAVKAMGAKRTMKATQATKTQTMDAKKAMKATQATMEVNAMGSTDGKLIA